MSLFTKLKQLFQTQEPIKNVRCKHCGTLLAKNLQGSIEIKCRKCKAISKFKN